LKADIKALITITNKDCVYTGYRPAHQIDGYLTTGLHEYIDTDRICKGESKEGFITFISPEAYPHSLKVGDKISFQEGATVVGYAEVLDVINDILKA
jgi:elongation factor Tu